VANLTPPNLTIKTTLADADYVVVWPTGAGGPLYAVTWSNAKMALATYFDSYFLQITNNLSDVGNAAQALTNLGAAALTTNTFTGLQTLAGGISTSGATSTLGGGATDATVIKGVSITKPNMSAFSLRLTADISHVTGDGTAYTIVFPTAVFDRHSDTASGVFTAPVTGLYQFNGFVTLSGVTSAHTRGILQIITTARTYLLDFGSPFAMLDASGLVGVGFPCLADMTAGDTAKLAIQVNNGTKVVSMYSNLGSGASNPTCHFSGFLVG
jgi:hypothetical protein